MRHIRTCRASRAQHGSCRVVGRAPTGSHAQPRSQRFIKHGSIMTLLGTHAQLSYLLYRSLPGALTPAEPQRGCNALLAAPRRGGPAASFMESSKKRCFCRSAALPLAADAFESGEWQGKRPPVGICSQPSRQLHSLTARGGA
jgi:hypothetical protein